MTGRGAVRGRVTGHIVVAGAGVAGLRAAEGLRARGWNGAVTVVGDEPYPPYDRPPLSKDVLGGERGAGGAAQAHAATVLRRGAGVADVTWRLGTPVSRAWLADRTLILGDGTRLEYDGLVVATGVRPRRVIIPGPGAGRHVLRTLDDAVALRERLRPERRVLIVGGGFVGCEVAATARRRGCDVTVVEPSGEPMQQALGPELGRVLRRHHQDRGVRFHLGRIVAELRDDAALLDDGTLVRADLIVEAVGSRPNVEWLSGNGLDLSDGVRCDNRLRVEGRPEVVAAGDVARFPNPRFDGVPRRVEHRCVPAATAERAAASLAAHLGAAPPDRTPFAPLPAFWSDQYDVRVQCFGAPALGDRFALLDGGLDHPRALRDGVAMAYYRDARVVGAALIGIPPAEHDRYRDLLTSAPVPA